MGQASPNKRTNAKTNTSSTPVYGAHPMLSSLQYQQFPTGIWVKGRGSEGQLCNGKTQHVSISQPIENLPNLLQNQQILQVVGECWHLVILTTAGQVFAAGWNDYGQVGHEPKALANSTIQRVIGLDLVRIVRIAAGEGHTLALDLDGNVYATGWNNYKQKGLDKDNTNKYDLVPDLANLVNQNDLGDYIVDVSCGYRNSFLVTKYGHVFACGDNGKSQIKAGLPSTVTKFTKLDIEDNIVQVASGFENTIMISRTGKLYNFGLLQIPAELQQLSYQQASAGMNMCVLLTTLNRCFMLDSSGKHEILLDNNDVIMQVNAGFYFNAILTFSGSVYTFGTNNSNECICPTSDFETGKPTKLYLDKTLYNQFGITASNQQRDRPLRVFAGGETLFVVVGRVQYYSLFKKWQALIQEGGPYTDISFVFQ